MWWNYSKFGVTLLFAYCLLIHKFSTNVAWFPNEGIIFSVSNFISQICKLAVPLSIYMHQIRLIHMCVFLCSWKTGKLLAQISSSTHVTQLESSLSIECWSKSEMSHFPLFELFLWYRFSFHYCSYVPRLIQHGIDAVGRGIYQENSSPTGYVAGAWKSYQKPLVHCIEDWY